MPPWMRAAWLTASTSSTLSMWRVEIVTTLSNDGLRLDALHHRRAAAIGDRLGADLVAPVEHAHDVLLVLGKGHGIGRVGHRAHEHAPGVEARLAVAVLQPRQVIGAHHRLQRRRHGDARRAQRDLLRLGRRRDVEAVQAVALGDLGLPRLDLVRRQILVGIAPGIELLLPPHVSSDCSCSVFRPRRPRACAAALDLGAMHDAARRRRRTDRGGAWSSGCPTSRGRPAARHARRGTAAA